jgi:cobalt-zinc-cadmium efflux system protein
MSSEHGHRQYVEASSRKLLLTLVLTFFYMIAEIVGGLLTNSLALLADAGHMLTDVAALGLSVFAMWIASRPPTTQRTYGYYRAEILAALVNAATLVVISLYIFSEAYRRFSEPPAVLGKWMMLIAAGGLAANLIGLWILNSGKSESLNVRGAWLHVATDALGSFGTIVAGALIYFFGWKLADPIASVLIAVLVLYSSWSLLKEALAVLMESAPAHIDVDKVRASLVGIPGVLSIHDLHIWTITTGIVALSAHVVSECPGDESALMRTVRESLHRNFGIHHSTIQMEPGDSPPCKDNCG